MQSDQFAYLTWPLPGLFDSGPWKSNISEQANRNDFAVCYTTCALPHEARSTSLLLAHPEIPLIRNVSGTAKQRLINVCGWAHAHFCGHGRRLKDKDCGDARLVRCWGRLRRPGSPAQAKGLVPLTAKSARVVAAPFKGPKPKPFKGRLAPAKGKEPPQPKWPPSLRDPVADAAMAQAVRASEAASLRGGVSEPLARPGPSRASRSIGPAGRARAPDFFPRGLGLDRLRHDCRSFLDGISSKLLAATSESSTPDARALIF